MSIKEARTTAGMTQQEVNDKWGIPIRSLQNWETGSRECASYLGEWLVEKLQQETKKARIRFEGDFCYLDTWDVERKCFSVVRRFEIKNNMVSIGLLEDIKTLTESGYVFCF